MNNRQRLLMCFSGETLSTDIIAHIIVVERFTTRHALPEKVSVWPHSLEHSCPVTKFQEDNMSVIEQ